MLALLLTAVAPANAQHQSVVTDPLTGVALSGYDPVAYFTDNEARPGDASNEVVWQGVSWYFASEANRDAFLSAPEIYAPRFGGHCAMSMSRGYLSDGNPTIFLIFENHLLLFYSVGNREAFSTNPNIALVRGQGKWDLLPSYSNDRLSVPDTLEDDGQNEPAPEET